MSTLITLDSVFIDGVNILEACDAFLAIKPWRSEGWTHASSSAMVEGRIDHDAMRQLERAVAEQSFVKKLIHPRHTPDAATSVVTALARKLELIEIAYIAIRSNKLLDPGPAAPPASISDMLGVTKWRRLEHDIGTNWVALLNATHTYPASDCLTIYLAVEFDPMRQLARIAAKEKP